ncbi:MAG: SDR family oxidoreductase [Planktomarina sp.]
MKTVLITGASKGIGAATAKAFWQAGWHVGLLARGTADLERMTTGKAATILPADVTKVADVDAAFNHFAQETGRIDVVFNNAGMFGPQGVIDDLAVEDWQQVLNVNVSGMFHVARAAFRHMRQQTPQGGRIINNGSVSAHAPREGSVIYTTTKHAITGMSKALSLDGRPFDIAVGQIDIGNARTDMIVDLENRRAADGLPPLPAMDVEAAANAVLHMAELPAEANIQNMTILATKMPFVGRG